MEFKYFPFLIFTHSLSLDLLKLKLIFPRGKTDCIRHTEVFQLDRHLLIHKSNNIVERFIKIPKIIREWAFLVSYLLTGFSEKEQSKYISLVMSAILIFGIGNDSLLKSPEGPFAPQGRHFRIHTYRFYKLDQTKKLGIHKCL